MRTRSDLVAEGLSNLGFLPQGQQPGPEEYEMLDGNIDGMLDELEAKEILYVPDRGVLGDPNSGQFEDKHFHLLGSILANAIKASFGQAGDPGLQKEADDAESDLYTIEAQRYTRQILPGQYF